MIQVNTEETIAKLAYTAGIVDGEGCIAIHKQKPRLHAVSPLHSLKVIVSNTNKKLIDWLLSNFGGSCYTPQRREENWKLAYKWEISSKEALDFLKQIYPYLILKKEQAEVGMSFQMYKMGRNGLRVSEEELIKREEYKQMIHKLNKRGNTL